MSEQRKTAKHEAGHHVCATNFGLASFPELTPGGYTPPGSAETLPYAGVCHHDRAKSAFQQAVICWAGVLAEHMLGECYEWSPPVPLTAEYLRDWFDMFLQRGFDHLSKGDQLGIVGDKRQWRTFRTAWKILYKNRARLRRLTDHIISAASPSTPEAKSAAAIDYRAQLLEKYLVSLPADHPDRPKFEKTLTYYKQGQWPPSELYGANQSQNS